MQIQNQNNPTSQTSNEKPLADLFVIFGLESTEIDSSYFRLDFKANPKVLDSYPGHIDEDQHQYIHNLEMICFPEDFHIIEAKDTFEKKHYKINNFTITQYDGLKKFATSIIFWELFSQKDYPPSKQKEKLFDTIWIPRAFCLISRLPIFELQKNILIKIYEFYQMDKLKTQKRIAHTPHPSSPPAQTRTRFLFPLKKKTQSQINLGDSITSQNEKEEKGEEGLNKIKYRDLLQCSEKIEFVLSILFHHLNFNIEYENEVELTYEDENFSRNTFLQYRNYKEYGFTLSNFNFKILLQKIQPSIILELFRFLILERKVILIHDTTGENAVIIESILSLLTPFDWNFVNISYITQKTMDCVEVPLPFIMGISRKNWTNMKEEKKDLDSDIFIYDIDNQVILQKEELPLLPEPAGSILSKNFHSIIEEKEMILKKAKNKKERKLIEEYYYAYATLRVRQIFFNFFVFVINNFEGFYMPKKNIKEKDDLDSNSASMIFNFDYYLSFYNEESKPFMREFVKTQNFINFIEQAYPNQRRKDNIGFFKHCLKILLRKSFKTLKIEQKKLVHFILHNFKNPKRYNLEDFYDEYQNMLREQTIATDQSFHREDLATVKTNKLLDQGKIIKMRPIVHKQPRRKKRTSAIEIISHLLSSTISNPAQDNHEAISQCSQLLNHHLRTLTSPLNLKIPNGQSIEMEKKPKQEKIKGKTMDEQLATKILEELRKSIQKYSNSKNKKDPCFLQKNNTTYEDNAISEKEKQCILNELKTNIYNQNFITRTNNTLNSTYSANLLNTTKENININNNPNFSPSPKSSDHSSAIMISPTAYPNKNKISFSKFNRKKHSTQISTDLKNCISSLIGQQNGSNFSINSFSRNLNNLNVHRSRINLLNTSMSPRRMDTYSLNSINSNGCQSPVYFVSDHQNFLSTTSQSPHPREESVVNYKFRPHHAYSSSRQLSWDNNDNAAVKAERICGRISFGKPPHKRNSIGGNITKDGTLVNMDTEFEDDKLYGHPFMGQNKSNLFFTPRIKDFHKKLTFTQTLPKNTINEESIPPSLNIKANTSKNLSPLLNQLKQLSQIQPQQNNYSKKNSFQVKAKEDFSANDLMEAESTSEKGIKSIIIQSKDFKKNTELPNSNHESIKNPERKVQRKKEPKFDDFQNQQSINPIASLGRFKKPYCQFNSTNLLKSKNLKANEPVSMTKFNATQPTFGKRSSEEANTNGNICSYSGAHDFGLSKIGREHSTGTRTMPHSPPILIKKNNKENHLNSFQLNPEINCLKEHSDENSKNVGSESSKNSENKSRESENVVTTDWETNSDILETRRESTEVDQTSTQKIINFIQDKSSQNCQNHFTAKPNIPFQNPSENVQTDTDSELLLMNKHKNCGSIIHPHRNININETQEKIVSLKQFGVRTEAQTPRSIHMNGNKFDFTSQSPPHPMQLISKNLKFYEKVFAPNMKKDNAGNRKWKRIQSNGLSNNHHHLASAKLSNDFGSKIIKTNDDAKDEKQIGITSGPVTSDKPNSHQLKMKKRLSFKKSKTLKQNSMTTTITLIPSAQTIKNESQQEIVNAIITPIHINGTTYQHKNSFASRNESPNEGCPKMYKVSKKKEFTTKYHTNSLIGNEKTIQPKIGYKDSPVKEYFHNFCQNPFLKKNTCNHSKKTRNHFHPCKKKSMATFSPPKVLNQEIENLQTVEDQYFTNFTQNSSSKKNPLEKKLNFKDIINRAIKTHKGVKSIPGKRKYKKEIDSCVTKLKFEKNEECQPQSLNQNSKHFEDEPRKGLENVNMFSDLDQTLKMNFRNDYSKQMINCRQNLSECKSNELKNRLSNSLCKTKGLIKETLIPQKLGVIKKGKDDVFFAKISSHQGDDDNDPCSP